MPEQQPELVAADLPMTLYLNQRWTFDILAALQGGFTNFTTVQTTSSDGKETQLAGGAQFGLGNAFGLFGIKLGAQGSQGAQHQLSAITTENIVHTPTSLFAQLRKELQQRGLVRYPSSPCSLSHVKPGDFVEFEATLRRNPLEETLSTFSNLISMMRALRMESTDTPNPRGQARRGNSGKGQGNRDEFAEMQQQIDQFLAAVSTGSSQDFIADMGTLRVVLTTGQEYFIDPTMNDTIDGTFRIFGKATRVVEDDTDEINLLRKAALGSFAKVFDFDAVTEKLEESSFTGSFETTIRGPTMQIIPIAIFA